MFSEQEVKDILSQSHLHNTALALQKCPSDVTADDLVEHWKRYHYATPTIFDVIPNISDNEPAFQHG